MGLISVNYIQFHGSRKTRAIKKNLIVNISISTSMEINTQMVIQIASQKKGLSEILRLICISMSKMVCF